VNPGDVAPFRIQLSVFAELDELIEDLLARTEMDVTWCHAEYLGQLLLVSR
jgi:hypothetical protein